MAHKVTKTRYEGGREGSLSSAGGFLLFLGIVGLVAGVGLAASVKAWDRGGPSWLWAAMGMSSLMWGIMMFMLFRAAAEGIRLLKKIAGMPHGGEISSVEPFEMFVCSECGKMPIKNAAASGERELAEVCRKLKVCGHCGAVFEGQE